MWQIPGRWGDNVVLEPATPSASVWLREEACPEAVSNHKMF